MSTFTFRASPLPTNFRGTPQQIFEAILERLELVSDSEDFVINDNMPTSNQGPWLKGGKQWWVWDEDTSTYVPLDVSASTNIKEIVVSAIEPPAPGEDDPKVWLKIDGLTVVGIFYWFGEPTGWVTVAAELQPNSITTEMLQDGSVSTPKLRDESITVEKMANNLPFTKFIKGLPYQFLRMDQFGAFAGWQNFVIESEEVAPPDPTSSSNAITIPHSLNTIPSIVRVVLVCKEDNNGFDAGDEVDLGFGANVEPGRLSFYKANTSSIVLYFGGHIRLYDPTGSWGPFLPPVASWKLKVYFAI